MAERKKDTAQENIELPPEWLIAEDSGGRSYIVHTRLPVFVGRICFSHADAHYKLPSGFGLSELAFYGEPPSVFIAYCFIAKAEQVLLRRYCAGSAERKHPALGGLAPRIASVVEFEPEDTGEKENWPDRVRRLASHTGGIAALARQSGFSRRTLTRYCNGSRTPRGLYRRRLLEFEGWIRAGR